VGEGSVILFVDLALVALVVSALCLATWRGRVRRRRARLARVAVSDLLPDHGLPSTNGHGVARPAAAPRVAVDPAIASATWSASVERGETAPPVEAPPAVAPAPAFEPAPVVQAPAPPPVAARSARPAVVVAPRGNRWVVRRDGASRVSSVHDSRAAAEDRARKTARRERVVLEIRDEDAVVIEAIDYSADGRAAVHANGATAPRS
jgi:Uncharacterized protein conserved in bacteria (DUF2188)